MNDTLEITPECAWEHAQAAHASAMNAQELASKKFAIECGIAQKEAFIAGAVALEVNGDNKPVFSNTDARKAETQRRCAEDGDMAKLRGDLTETNWELAQCQLDSDLHRRAVRIICTFAGKANADPLADPGETGGEEEW